MLSNSFNMMDANKTVLDNVDMDMTSAVDGAFYAGSADDDPAFMDFGSSPSKEIKHDVSSFLSSLKAKPSDR